MKTSKRLKATILILVIVLITIISFLGVYNIFSVHGDNLVKDYSVGMELKGKKIFRLKVDDTINDVIYDSEGNIVKEKEEGKEYTEKQEPVNQAESLTRENYAKAFKIVEKRLEYMDAKEYKLRFDEETGVIEIELIEDNLIDYILSAVSQKGEFKLIDEETKEVLLDESSVKNTGVLYSTAESMSTTVYLDIEFDKDGAKKLEEISNTYRKTTENVTNDDGNQEEKTIEKKVEVKIDDNSIISTSFGESLTNGHMYISVGQAATNNEELQGYALQASVYASIIKSGATPITYSIEQNESIVTDMNKNIIPAIAVIALVIEVVILIVMFKLKGIIASILQIGYISLLLLILKYTNVYITLEGVFAIVFASILNMILLYRILKSGVNASKTVNENLIKFINLNVPLLIVSIVFCFANWLEITSFGMVMFWGYVISILYNILFTKCMLKNIFDK